MDKKIGHPRTVDYDTVVAKILEIGNIPEGAKQLGMKEATVRRICQVKGIKLPYYIHSHPKWNQIYQRVLETRSSNAVAKEFGISQSAVQRIAKKLGFDWQSVPRPHKVLSDKFAECPYLEQMIAEVKQYQSIVYVAQKYRFSVHKLQHICSQYGIKVGRGHKSLRARKGLDLQKIVAEYQSGLNCKEIGSRYGVDSELIRDILAEQGIERRIGKASDSKNPQWKGNKPAPMHYFRRQSYEVAAICLGKPLPQGHVIHHLDENPENNNPSNLFVFASQALHAGFHQKALNLQKKGIQFDDIQLVLECGGIALPQPPHPIEF